MARGRMIDKRICVSNKFARLKKDKHRLLYLMILPHLDVEGKFTSDPQDIKDECVRKLMFSIKQIIEGLVALHNIGLIRLYVVDEKLYLEYDKFTDFQKIIKKREGESHIANNCAPPATGLQQWCDRTALIFNLSLSSIFKEGTKKKKELMYFSFEEAKFFNIKEEHIVGWKQAYPACDIIIELYKMREWLLANPAQAKSNYRRFIVNWLTSQQNKGGTKGIDKQRFSGIKEWFEGELEKGTHEAK